MAHGPMAGYADIISKEDLYKIMGNGYKDTIDMLMEKFGEHASGEIFNDNLLLKSLADMPPIDIHELWQTYMNFRLSFYGIMSQKILGVLPGLSLCHHSDEEGCYDEVTGLYWKLDNIYVKTAPCREIEAIIGHEINRAFMVTYG